MNVFARGWLSSIAVWLAFGCAGFGCGGADHADRSRDDAPKAAAGKSGRMQQSAGQGAAAHGAAATRDGGSGQAGRGNAGASSDALNVHVETPDALTIELVTLRCAGDCAEVVAVAHGGNTPYAFEWEDGSTTAEREICRDAADELSVSVTDTAVDDDEFAYEARTESTNVGVRVLDCGDAGPSDTGNCDLGGGVVLPQRLTSDVTGAVTYFADGAELPAGRYRITYVDGCMQFSPIWGWSVQNLGMPAFWLVHENSNELLVNPPSGASGIDFQTDFEACVTSTLQNATPVDFDFAGGRLGLWLNDTPYDDNIVGEDGRNPTWELTLPDCP